MKDIIERLEYYRDVLTFDEKLMNEAIAEIDTFRAEVARLKRAAEINAIMAARGVSVMGDLA